MEAEQDKTLRALQVAIQMEIDGKEFYLKASRESGNELGKKLLASLASEEDVHRQKFEEIYRALREKKGWPETDFTPDGGKSLRTLFAAATAGSGVKAQASELDAVKTAMAMENKTYDYYKNQRQTATYDGERDFYQALMAQEREHYLVLLDYYEYLKDPAGWFVQKEHPSLDGG
jgi:rubrerythrin